jgi:hypothetical protein
MPVIAEAALPRGTPRRRDSLIARRPSAASRTHRGFDVSVSVELVLCVQDLDTLDDTLGTKAVTRLWE